VLQTALWTLRQRRYAALAAAMLGVAIICVVAGTWQISRFEQSVHDNDALDRNARSASVPLTRALVPLVGTASAPGRDAVRYRTVSTEGTYLDQAPQFVRNQSVNGSNGYYVLNPLRTDAGVLLVVRGFVADEGTGAAPSVAGSLPGGLVQVSGRLQTADTKADDASELSDGELESINASEQAARLQAPVYDTYLTLNAGQPGTDGVTVLPDPDLSNPAGGAYEAQHFAYILQWYLFALLALAAPFVIGRHEVREARKKFLGIDPAQQQFGAVAGTPGRALTDGSLPDGAASSVVAVRGDGTLVRSGELTAQDVRRAEHLADRYGRSLGTGPTAAGTPIAPAAPPRRSDTYQGSYNDYLWELALADGDTPPVDLPPDE
jgi:cytochrome oxidase assembly protein ShyY1